MRTLICTLGFCLVANAIPLHAQDHGHSSTHSTNTTQKDDQPIVVDGFRIETTILKRGIFIVVTDSEGKKVPTENTTGKMTLRVGENPKTFAFELKALKNGAMGAAIDLSRAENKPLHLQVELNGVGRSPLQFETTGQFNASLSDAMLISLQKTCPVSNKPLGSMGTPPKIQHDGKSLFVCCDGCTSKVKSSPQAYFDKYYSARGTEVRPGIYESTLADADAIQAQKKCPVMDEDLGGMGVPQKVNVKGKAVYICCAGCAKKLESAPEKYLQILDRQGVSAPEFK